MATFSPEDARLFLAGQLALEVSTATIKNVTYDPFRHRLIVRYQTFELREINGVSPADAERMLGLNSGGLPDSQLEDALLNGRGRPPLKPPGGLLSELTDYLDHGEWVLVISSNVHALRWERDTNTLQVEFCWGGVYPYRDVDEGLAREFYLAFSKGKFHWQHLRNRATISRSGQTRGPKGAVQARNAPCGPDRFKAERRRGGKRSGARRSGRSTRAGRRRTSTAAARRSGDSP